MIGVMGPRPRSLDWLLGVCLILFGFASPSSAAFLSIPQNYQIMPGETITIALNLTRPSGDNTLTEMSSIDIHIQFDTNLFTVDGNSIRAGSFLSSNSFAFTRNTTLAATGDIVANAFVQSPVAIPTGVNQVLLFDLTAKSNATPGQSSYINLVLDAPLLSTGQIARTRIDGQSNGSNLSPPPSNVVGDPNDGLVQINAIPEPSSIALLIAGCVVSGFVLRKRPKPKPV